MYRVRELAEKPEPLKIIWHSARLPDDPAFGNVK